MKNKLQGQKDNFIKLLSPRALELIAIDTGIYLAIIYFVKFLSTLSIYSFKVHGAFTLPKILVFYVCIIFIRILFSMYNSVLRYADPLLYAKLLLSDAIASGLYFFIGRWIYKPSYIGFAITITIYMMVSLATITSRLVYQLFYSLSSTLNDDKNGTALKINIAIVGAGNIGATLATELSRNPNSHYKPMMFIDKDKRKIGSVINGIKVYPENDATIAQIKTMPIQEIVIAIPDSSVETKNSLFERYKQTNCKVRLYDYPIGDRPGEKSNEGSKRTLRDFHIEDLLFRDMLNVKSEAAANFYNNKVVLVTGGGGSIGSELCRQIAKMGPKKLVILDIYENNAYEIEQELIRKYGRFDPITREGLNLETIIASVRDVTRLEEIFNEIRPQIVFHAAAHKHVPLMENSGCEAIKNNVFGTYNVANMAEKYGVEKFLLISTDKAVNPTNIMGASKRLCEMVIQCRKDSKTEFTAVRFGNVLGSNGSVIPLFRRQIEAGGPVTITDKRIIRYFMTIPEAVGLVMETCAMARNGELYVLDMGKPVKIIDLAENMIRLVGLKPYEDIDIIEIGLRPGEKLYEELLMKKEELNKTDNDMIFIEKDLGLPREEVEEKLRVLSEAIIAQSSQSASHGHRDDVLRAIKATVPTFHDPNEINNTAIFSREMLNAR